MAQWDCPDLGGAVELGGLVRQGSLGGFAGSLGSLELALQRLAHGGRLGLVKVPARSRLGLLDAAEQVSLASLRDRAVVT